MNITTFKSFLKVWMSVFCLFLLFFWQWKLCWYLEVVELYIFTPFMQVALCVPRLGLQVEVIFLTWHLFSFLLGLDLITIILMEVVDLILASRILVMDFSVMRLEHLWANTRVSWILCGLYPVSCMIIISYIYLR